MGINFDSISDLPEKYQKQVYKKTLAKDKDFFNTPEKSNKYKNEKIDIDGMTFDSQKESKRYSELKILEMAGEITNLERQVPFTLIPNQRGEFRNERAVKYVADFTYWQNGEMVVEDVKSEMTRKLPAYILKRKMMKFIKNIEVKEI